MRFDLAIVDEPFAEPVDGTHLNRNARRGTDKPQPPVPAVRSNGKTGMCARGDVRDLPPNDMRPREVDRKAIKAKRKQATKTRRKRK